MSDESFESFSPNLVWSSEYEPGIRIMHHMGDSSGSVFSSPATRYKLPVKPNVCVFTGLPIPSADVVAGACASSPSSSPPCPVRGIPTSTWGPEHAGRLNFRKVSNIQRISKVTSAFNTIVQEQLINLLFEPLKDIDGPEIVTDSIRKTLSEALTDDPVIQYMEAVVEDMMDNNIDMNDLTENDKPALEEYFHKMTNQQKTKLRKIRNNVDLSEETIRKCNKSLAYICRVCASNRASELELDDLIAKVMRLIVKKEGSQNFEICKREETRVHFDCCGAQGMAETHVLWKYNQREIVFSSDGFPIVLCENSSPVTVVQKVYKPTGKHNPKRVNSSHKKISQVVGQCVSIADKSPFQTEDYKIVYHVSLMGTSKVVVTRTHVAKSTLKVFKDGGEIPKQIDLDSSYVFESSFAINNNVVKAFFLVYAPLLMLGKVAHMLFSHQPSVTLESDQRNSQDVSERKSSAEPAPKRKKY